MNRETKGPGAFSNRGRGKGEQIVESPIDSVQA